MKLAIAEIERLSRTGFPAIIAAEPLESGFEQSTFVQRAARLWIEGLRYRVLQLLYHRGLFIRGDRVVSVADSPVHCSPPSPY